MSKYIVDLETSVTYIDGVTRPEVKEGAWKNKFNSSPYDTTNHLVAVGIKNVETGEVTSLIFYHSSNASEHWYESAKRLQAILDSATLIIGHNLKFDMSWLYECGFKYDGPLYDTMIFEYVAAKGLKPGLSLSACAERYGLEPKLDILKNYLDSGVNTDQIPLDELTLYLVQDIETTYQLYTFQRKRFKEDAEIPIMWPSMKLSMETLEVLIDIERTGIKIDIEALDAVEKEYREEKRLLEDKLNDMVRSVMGDSPINLASSQDMVKVVYSLEVKDKKQWAELFNIGTDENGKKKYVKRYKDANFRDIIRQHTNKVYRTEAVHCEACNGKGHIQKYKKDKVYKKTGVVVPGEPHKNPTKCKSCDGAKVIYVPTHKVAGFRVKPIDSEYATSAGFSTDKTTIDDLVSSGGATLDAEVFLRSLQRLNAIDTYLSAFVDGIRNSIKSDGMCHPNFNQCVTTTGRTSSSGPNWQNQPRGGTFPIRRAIISRFEGGVLMPADGAALEYRVAVMSGKCPAGLQSILEGKDRHQLSAEILFGILKEDTEEDAWKNYRQKAKAGTFQPLFAGKGQTDKSQAYAEAFFEEHYGLKKWHEELGNEALKNKQVVTISGRHFAFPHTKRNEHGRVSGMTKIANYPVQSFTFDLMWSIIVPLWREMKALNLKSKIILQVHDDVVPDVHPDEVDIMLSLIKKHFDNVWEYLTERFKYVTNVPIGYEISIGSNLMDKKTVYEKK
jgi:DNA polymerase I-like protein with 3'-5' exonuclease and polymerase domains